MIGARLGVGMGLHAAAFADVDRVSHDDTISYLAATGHQGEYQRIVDAGATGVDAEPGASRQPTTPVAQWVPAARWQAFTRIEAVLPLVTIVLALFLAFMLNVGGRSDRAAVVGVRGAGFYKIVYFFPVVLSVAILAVLWQAVYRGDQGGLLNGLLMKLGIVDEQQPWAFVASHWPDIERRFPTNSLARLVGGIRTVRDASLADEIAAFLDAHPIPQGDKQVRQHVETVHARHLDVEQDQIETGYREEFDSGLTAGRSQPRSIAKR